ncbi:heat shock protein HslJ [Lacibacter cauensis]|uniref:Heat shock protein HslJ n=1 Tax=Lacibacter cauensis TaxID=510947 RepID=A0A562SVV0_9BACT|nr:META domain-containing protein [Lacibacter cauensis]TWI85417.1 heat shock protein HslJ [Lacibacter cauensis]
MKYIVISLSVCLGLLQATSCKTSKTNKTVASSNTVVNPPNIAVPVVSEGSEYLYMYRWYVSEINGKAVTLADQAKAAHLIFSPGQVSTVAGSTGCNRLTGSFELMKDNAIKFSPLAVTKMACMNSGDVESNFLSALSKTSKWIIRNRELYFYEEDKLLVKFASVDAAVAKLEGNWELNYISGSRIAFDGLYPEKKPFIRFDLANSQINGNTSCNGFSSKYTINGNNIKFAPGISTMMACPGNGEKAFNEMLLKVNRYALSDDNALTFLMGDIAVMRFVRK